MFVKPLKILGAVTYFYKVFFLRCSFSLQIPKCGKQLLFALHRHVQQQNPIRNCYSNQLFAPRHIQKLVTSVAAVGEREREN